MQDMLDGCSAAAAPEFIAAYDGLAVEAIYQYVIELFPSRTAKRGSPTAGLPCLPSSPHVSFDKPPVLLPLVIGSAPQVDHLVKVSAPVAGAAHAVHPLPRSNKGVPFRKKDGFGLRVKAAEGLG